MENLIQRLSQVKDREDSRTLFLAMEGLYERLRCQTVNSAALRIKGGSASAIVQTNAVWYGVVRSLIVKIASGTDWADLSGTVTNAAFNVFVFTVDKDGTKYTQMGTEGATIGTVKWPTIDQGRAIAGFLIINPTGTGDFVGGTTVLDDATVVPNAVFINTLGAFDPTAYTGV